MTDREARQRALDEQFLPDDLVQRIRGRAASVDRDNAFFDDDLADLVAAGYLTTFVPVAFGGPGLTLGDVSRLQQRLAGASPSTALAVNMHLMLVGVARALHERGDESLQWVFDDALAGEIFAFGVSEPGNDWVLQGANSTATPTDGGGYTITGTKIFTSLSPVWTRLIVHGYDASADRLVFGFVERADAGVTVSDEWDVLGMRGSQSRATILQGARIAADRVARVIPPGRHPDLLTFAITAHFQLLVGSVYAGLARRALDVGADAVRQRRSAKAGVSLADVPEFRVRLGDALLDALPVFAQLALYAREFDEQVDHGSGWAERLVSARLHAGRAARSAAEVALQVAGGAGFQSSHEASRLYRDAAASLFHPPSADAARPLFAASLLDD